MFLNGERQIRKNRNSEVFHSLMVHTVRWVEERQAQVEWRMLSPQRCVSCSGLCWEELSSHVTQIKQSYKEQLSFVPSPVRNGRQSLQAPHSTRDTFPVPTPDPFPPLTLLGLGVGTCRSKSRSCLLLSLQTINAFSCGPAEGLEAD